MMKVESGRIIAIDFGAKRLGIAISDPLQVVASPLGIISRSTNERDFDQLSNILEEYQPAKIAIGLPLDSTGIVGIQAISVIRWARKLSNHTTVPIVFIDESFSSRAAHDIGKSNRKKRGQKRYVDDIAAAAFLQEHLISFQVAHESYPTLETFANIA